MVQDLVADYGRDGFAFRPGLLSSTEAGVLVRETEQLLLGERRGDRFVLEKDGSHASARRQPAPVQRRLRPTDPPPDAAGCGRGAARRQVYVFQLGVNCKAAFNGDVWFWHQDYPDLPRRRPHPEPRMVNALIFLDEVTNLNGPLMIVPGSHRLTSRTTPEESTEGTSYTLRYAEPDTIEAQVRRGGVVAPTGPAGFGHLHERQRAARLDREPVAVAAADDHARPTTRCRTRRPARASARATSSTTTPICRPWCRSTRLPGGLAARCSRRTCPQWSTTRRMRRGPVWAEIDLGAITHNLALIRERAGRPVS